MKIFYTAINAKLTSIPNVRDTATTAMRQVGDVVDVSRVLISPVIRVLSAGHIQAFYFPLLIVVGLILSVAPGFPVFAGDLRRALQWKN